MVLVQLHCKTRHVVKVNIGVAVYSLGLHAVLVDDVSMERPVTRRRAPIFMDCVPSCQLEMHCALLLRINLRHDKLALSLRCNYNHFFILSFNPCKCEHCVLCVP